MTADTILNAVFEQIPERDQSALLQKHGVTTIHKLMAMKNSLQQRALDGVCAEVQLVLQHFCTYLDSLDNTSTDFSWEGFENFCGYNDTSGITLAEDFSTNRNRNDVSNDDADADPDGYNLTSEERKQMEDAIENDPLNIMIRGFSPRSLQFEFDEASKKKEVQEASDKTEVAFNGNVYYKNKCYTYQQPGGATVTVGIRKFTSVSDEVPCNINMLLVSV
jgi:hypothetical protein